VRAPIPQPLYRELKVHCVTAETSVVDFVVQAIEEKLKAGWRTLPPWLFFAAVDPATYAADDPAAGLLDPGNVRRAIRRLTEALHAEDVAAGLSPEASFPTAWTPHGGRPTVATQLL
jgi:hypothetical protein